MNKFYILLLAFVYCAYVAFAGEVNIDLGASYANDVWYDFNNGVVKTEPYNNWDLFIKTSPKNCSIGINSQKGLELWLVPGLDDSNWKEQIDTNGFQNKWTAYYNSDSTWNIGAFNLNKDGYTDNTGDYGWGQYDFTSHYVLGDKIFVLKLNDTTYKKIMIESLISGVFTIKWANLDGSNECSQAVKVADYSTKLFVYISMQDNKIVDREPASDSWALLFGKYTAFINNSGTVVPYGVTGVRTNPIYRSAKLVSAKPEHEKSPALSDNVYLTNIANIGYDWKTFSMDTYQYKVSDSLVYFITKAANTDANPEIHKILFTSFEGSSTGKLTFSLDEYPTGVDFGKSNVELLYPNIVENGDEITIPSDNNFNNIVYSNVSIIDLKGNILFTERNFNNKIVVNDLSAGVYWLEASNGCGQTKLFKFMVK